MNTYDFFKLILDLGDINHKDSLDEQGNVISCDPTIVGELAGIRLNSFLFPIFVHLADRDDKGHWPLSLKQKLELAELKGIFLKEKAEFVEV